MEDIPWDMLPDQVPMGVSFSQPPVFNQLLPFSGGCQFYVLPSGGMFHIPPNNVTNYTTWSSDSAIIYALNCDYNDTQYREVWDKIMRIAPRVPFASSLAPLMVVLTMCVVTSWIIIGLMAVLKRFKRPITHQITMIYICVLLTVLYVYLHHFSRQEHMGGFESTDTFTHYFFSTERAVSIFLAFTGIMLCECHVIYSVYTDPRNKLIIFLGGLAWFAAVQGVWIAGVADHRAYNAKQRVLNSKIQVYFYLDIASHAFYALAYIIRVVSLWRYAFTKRNRTLAILSCVGTAVPFISMIVTTIPSGCFRWSMPLSMVLRSISLVLSWDWFVYTELCKTERETDDPLGRLITQPDLKRELNATLDHDGDGYGAFYSKSLVSRMMDRLQNPKSLLSKISIFGVGAQSTNASEDLEPSIDIGSSVGQQRSAAARSRARSKSRRDSIIQHHPVAKHKITNKDSAFKALGSSERTSSNGRPFLTHTNSSHPSRANSGHCSASTQPQLQRQSSSTAPSEPQPGPSTIAAAAAAEEMEILPNFVPHPGFRSGDYNNEKH